MTARIVRPEEAREMLDGTTPGPWVAEYSASSHLYVTQSCDPHEDIATDLDASDANARLMSAAPDLAATVASEPERMAAAVEAGRRRIVADLREWARQSAHRTGNYADALNAAADEVEAGREP